MPTLLIQQPLNLARIVPELSQSLQAIQPKEGQSETTQIITYTLLGAAIVGIFVYHYIKQNENATR